MQLVYHVRNLVSEQRKAQKETAWNVGWRWRWKLKNKDVRASNVMFSAWGDNFTPLASPWFGFLPSTFGVELGHFLVNVKPDILSPYMFLLLHKIRFWFQSLLLKLTALNVIHVLNAIHACCVYKYVSHYSIVNVSSDPYLYCICKINKMLVG